MRRTPKGSSYLYGLHDPGGEQLMLGAGVPGWVLVTTEVGYDPNNTSGQNFSALTERGLGVIVRLNAGYAGVGTLPFERYYDNFARRCANFVANSPGANHWIVGNETNHPIEWPGADWDWGQNPPRPRRADTEGEKITPDRYAACYKKVRAAIHALPGHAEDQVLVGGVAPWNNLTTYPGNLNGDWVRYFSDILTKIGAANCDGITLHTYTHGTDPALIQSEEKLQAAGFQQYHYHFRAYRDFMAVIPADMRGLPVYITETDQGDVEWRNENSGWVRAAYSEIAAWNRDNRQKIYALILYRWPRVGNDRWWIEGKSGVIEDFKLALKTPEPPKPTLADRVAAAEKRAAELKPRIEAAAGLAPQVAALRAAVDELHKEQTQADGLLKIIAAAREQMKAIADQLPQETDEFAKQIKDIAKDLPHHLTLTSPSRSLADIKRVIVHHTGGKPDVTPQRIAEVQVGQGKAGITYHFLVYADGTLYQTQPLNLAISQTLTQAINADGVAVTLVGNFGATPPPAAQLDKAAELIAWLLIKLGLPVEAVYGRSDLEPTIASPGAQWLQGAKYKFTLLSQVKEYKENWGDCAARLARAVQRIRELEGRVAVLQPQADQVPALLKRIKELEDEKAALREKLLQCNQGVPKPAIVDHTSDLLQHPTARYGPRASKITHLIIHHTETPKVYPLANLASWFVNHYDWPGMAYHYVIAADGTINQCQPDEIHSYHAEDANGYSVAISLIGSFMPTYKDKPQSAEDRLPTPAQLRSAAHLAAWLMQKYNIALENVKGHQEVNNTQCPGDFWTDGPAWKSDLHTQIKAFLAGQNVVGQPMEHYLLFWEHGQDWASADWKNAQDYIARFRPTTGFSVADARLARHVTIVGGDAGVTGTDEATLLAAGVKVHRLAGQDEAATKALLSKLVADGTPWPGAPVTAPKTPPHGPRAAAEPTAPPNWNAPLDWLPTEGAPPAEAPIERRVRVRFGIH